MFWLLHGACMISFPVETNRKSDMTFNPTHNWCSKLWHHSLTTLEVSSNNWCSKLWHHSLTTLKVSSTILKMDDSNKFIVQARRLFLGFPVEWVIKTLKTVFFYWQDYKDSKGMKEVLWITGWVETNPSNIRKHLYLTSAKAISIVPWGEVTDVRRENTDIRWVGFHPLRVFVPGNHFPF